MTRDIPCPAEMPVSAAAGCSGQRSLYLAIVLQCVTALPVFAAEAGSVNASGLEPLSAAYSAVNDDFNRIAGEAHWPSGGLRLKPPVLQPGPASVRIACDQGGGFVQIQVTAPAHEWAATAYLALRKLGFLFPHPRWQISPAFKAGFGHCNEVHVWTPRLKYRGFHLHTLHPNEWVSGFLQGDTAIAIDMVRWSARNQQNLLQVALLSTIDMDTLSHNLQAPFALAHTLGISTGVNVGLVQVQQMSRRLMPVFGLFFGEYFLRQRLASLIEGISFDFLTLDFGVTEFHDTPRPLTLKWIDLTRRTLEAHGRRLFGKVHVSKPTPDSKDNYNYLIGDSANSVGVLPHTVMFYGLNDPYAPVYGRSTFADMRDFMLQQSTRRPTWYFPETSYWIGMDVDIPLLLTDYLTTRSEDMDFLEQHGIEGQITFTSGQECGYWLFDWTVALLNDAEYRQDPLSGLALLGEDLTVWQAILTFQHHYFKERQLIQQLSSANILDELPPPVRHSVHTRNTLADLFMNPDALYMELAQLDAGRQVKPPVTAVKNTELRKLLEVTFARIDHAYWLREALAHRTQQDNDPLDRARQVRLAAQDTMQGVQQAFNRYPAAHLFELGCTGTSYAFGTLWPAVTLHFWEREEAMIRSGRQWPLVYFNLLFRNIWNPFAVILDITSPRCWF